MDGQVKEVYVDGLDQLYMVECFTIRAAATALGRTELCVKRWIRDGLIPSPILRDTLRHYKNYSVGELTVIAREIAEHEREFEYFTIKHVFTIEAIWNGIMSYRSRNI